MNLAADPDFFDLLVESYRRSVGAPPPFLEAGEPHSALWLYRDASPLRRRPQHRRRSALHLREPGGASLLWL